MKNSTPFIQGSARWLWFALSLMGAITTYAALAAYSSVPHVSSGTPISASAWNLIADYANKAVKQDSEVITVSGDKVGIGIPSPTEALSVNGVIMSKWNSDVSRSPSMMLMRVNGADVFDWTALTADIGMGLWLTNFVAGGKINSDATGWNYLWTRWASKLHLWDGFLSLETSTSSTWSAWTAIGWNAWLYMTASGSVWIWTLAPTEKLEIAGGNIKMGYEIVTSSVSAASAVGWYYATCPTGKYALGWACSTWAGTAPTNTDVTSTAYWCYKTTTSTNWQIKAVCANMR